MTLSSTIFPEHLSLDARTEQPICLDTGTPELSWNVRPLAEGAFQSGYRILAATVDGEVLWDSGKISCSRNQWIPWEGPPLPSAITGTISVQLFDQNGAPSDFSSPINFFTGYFSNQEWGNAHWIWDDRNNYSTTAPSPYFRRKFHVRQGLRSARLSITARGIFEAFLDGRKISNDLLTPGWVEFRRQQPYLVYFPDLSEGPHVLGALLADGWCCGNLSILRKRNFYHPHPELLARLELRYDDGTTEFISTDSSWTCATGPILFADLYDGVDYDARLEIPEWCTSDFDDREWHFAADGGTVQETPRLLPRTAPAVRVTEILQPTQILNPKKDTFIWDFGQNFSGSYRLRLRGISGRRYTFRPAEMLEDDGSIYTLNYRSARSQDSYICRESDEGSWQEFSPTLTFHGFRYLQIDGFQFERIKPEELQVEALVIRSDIPITASFHCGNALVSRLWLNALWGQKSNFLEIPTDCPQRDERMGWTGDAELFSQTAMYNGDCRAFFRKYLRDVREAMTEEGAAPSIAPAILRIQDGAAAWGDAIILIPYNLYQHYGWKAILDENYSAMCDSLNWQKEHSQGFTFPSGQFGDWLAMEETPRSLVAAAYFIHCTHCMTEIASALNKTEDANAFAALEQESRDAFSRNFIGNDGIPVSCSQTALLMSIACDLIPLARRTECIQILQQKILDNGTRLSTGFIGTAWLLPTLSKIGLKKLACDLILQEKYPSWLYSVKQGATTIWERWNSYSREEGFGDVAMNSFNHYAYGTVANFLLTELGGIHYTRESLVFKIIPDRRFSPVSASYDSPRGRVTSQWHYDEAGVLHWSVSFPPGIQAKAELPQGRSCQLKAGETCLI